MDNEVFQIAADGPQVVPVRIDYTWLIKPSAREELSYATQC